MQRWLVRFGYDGRPFAGWAQQPGRRTVEGELLRAIARRPAVLEPLGAGLQVASRTDRGVSARGNALALGSRLGGPALLRLLNSLSPFVWFTAARPIPPEFRVRRAVRRSYRYFEPPSETPAAHRLSTWHRAAALFEGPVDVRSFGRQIPDSEPCWREVERVGVRVAGGGMQLDIRAPAFVWGMVRKIVGGIREVEAGHVSMTDLERAARGELRLTLPLAEPEGLVLWEVEYGTKWTSLSEGPGRAQIRAAERARSEPWIRARVTEAIYPGPRNRRPGRPVR